MAATMTKEQIEEKVRKVVITQLQVEPDAVTSDSVFADDLGADSLDLTELAIAFEDEFDIEIPESDFDRLTTVQGVVDYLIVRLP